LIVQQVRVVQRNLVYAVGMPLSICREEVSCAGRNSSVAARVCLQPAAGCILLN
jgi:hypothetical protein